MTNFAPVHYSDQKQFDAFVEQILLFNKNDPQHGRLIIHNVEHTSIYQLQVKEKPHWLLRILSLFYKPENERADRIGAYAYSIFVANKDYAKNNIIQSIEALAKLSSLFATTSSNIKYNSLLAELITSSSQNASSLEKDKQAALQTRVSRENVAHQSAQNALAQARTEGYKTQQSLIQKGKSLLKVAQDTQKALQEKIQIIRPKLIYFSEHEDKYHDALILAKGAKKLTTSFEFVSNSSLIDNIAANCKSIEITDEHKNTHAYLTKGYDLSKYSEETIRAFLSFLKHNTINCPPDHLCEFYRLAMELKIDSLAKSCLEMIIDKKIIDLDKAIALLSADETYSAKDPLLDFACLFVSENIQSACVKDNFKMIKHDHMIVIAQHEALAIEDEFQLLSIIKIWSGARRKDLKTVLKKEINGRTLLDCLRFQYFTQTQFVEATSERSLPNKIVRQWTTYFIKPTPIETPLTDRGIIRVMRYNNGSTKICVNIDSQLLVGKTEINTLIEIAGRKIRVNIYKNYHPKWRNGTLYINFESRFENDIKVKSKITNINLSKETNFYLTAANGTSERLNTLLPRSDFGEERENYTILLEIPPLPAAL